MSEFQNDSRQDLSVERLPIDEPTRLAMAAHVALHLEHEVSRIDEYVETVIGRERQRGDVADIPDAVRLLARDVASEVLRHSLANFRREVLGIPDERLGEVLRLAKIE